MVPIRSAPAETGAELTGAEIGDEDLEGEDGAPPGEPPEGKPLPPEGKPLPPELPKGELPPLGIRAKGGAALTGPGVTLPPVERVRGEFVVVVRVLVVVVPVVLGIPADPLPAVVPDAVPVNVVTVGG